MVSVYFKLSILFFSFAVFIGSDWVPSSVYEFRAAAEPKGPESDRN